MKKTAEVFSLIGIIEGFVTALFWIVLAIVSFVMGSGMLDAEIIQAVNEGRIVVNPPMSPEQVAQMIDAAFVAVGVVFILFAPFSIVSGVLSIFGRKSIIADAKDTKAKSILNIVFGVLGCNACGLVGGILGVIYAAKSKL